MWSAIKRIPLNLYRAYSRFSADDGFLMAGAVAYYVGLSLFPLLMVLIAGLGLFFEYSHLGQNAEEQLLLVIGQNVGPQFQQQMAELLSQVREKSLVGGPIGILTILLAAIAAFAQFEQAFDRIWGVEQKQANGVWMTLKHVLLDRSVAFLMLLFLGMAVVAMLAASVALSAATSYAQQILPVPLFVQRALQTLLPVAFNCLVLTALYRLLPDRPVKWSEAAQGAVVAGVSWEMGRKVLASYLINTKYTDAYGVIGTFLAILLWCYYAVIIVFIGAEYIQEICEQCTTRETATAEAKEETHGAPGARRKRREPYSGPVPG